ncbi:hypothetical protein DV736_g2703, partial [Chaetothyriales sp. CBS 134916]
MSSTRSMRRPHSGLDKMNNTAFFYGTLMAPNVLYRVIYGTPHPTPLNYPSMNLLKIHSALLHDHQRHRVLGCDYPGVIPHRGGSVKGTVVSGLTEGDVLRLDIFEGSQYERRRVKVRLLRDIEHSEGGPLQFEKKLQEKEKLEQDVGVEEVEAQTYIWIDDPLALELEEWDFEEFKRDKMQAWMGLSTEDTNGVKMDEGFNDVDRAQAPAGGSVYTDSGPKDGMGGRGVNGHIGRELAEAQTKGHQDFASGVE